MPTEEQYELAVKYWMNNGWSEESARRHARETHPNEVIEAADSQSEFDAYINGEHLMTIPTFEQAVCIIPLCGNGLWFWFYTTVAPEDQALFGPHATREDAEKVARIDYESAVSHGVFDHA